MGLCLYVSHSVYLFMCVRVCVCACACVCTPSDDGCIVSSLASGGSRYHPGGGSGGNVGSYSKGGGADPFTGMRVSDHSSWTS